MKRFLNCVVALLVAMVSMGTGGTAEADSSRVIQQGSDYEAIYNANLPWTINGNNVTNVAIFEEGSGEKVSLDFP